MYVTVAELKTYLPQLAGLTTEDGVLEIAINAAEAHVNRRLGYTFGVTRPTAVLIGDGTPYLALPAHTTPVTLVTALAGYGIPDYVERDDFLLALSGGVLTFPGPSGIVGNGQGGTAWRSYVPYTVTATFGYGPVPEDVRECVRQLSIRIWRFRDAGGSDVVGVEGAGAVTVGVGETPWIKGVLTAYAKRLTAAGVY